MWYRSNKNEAINIRFLSPEDANDVFEIYSDPQVTKNTNWERESVTFEAIKDFVDECIESFLNEDSVTYSVAKDNKVIALATEGKNADYVRMGEDLIKSIRKPAVVAPAIEPKKKKK